MTVTNSVISISLTLSILCLGIVCAGQSDFESSIAELKALVADQQDTVMELKKEVSEITKQEQFNNSSKSCMNKRRGLISCHCRYSLKTANHKLIFI